MSALWLRVMGTVEVVAAAIILLGGLLCFLLLDREYWGDSVFITVVGALLLLLFALKDCLNARLSRRNTPKMENLTLKLGDTELTEKYSGVVVQMPYHNIARVFHYRGCYFLFLDDRRAHFLPERAFVVGDPKNFPAFIEEKTGKRVEYI